MCNKSESIGKIALALVAFSGDVRAIEKDGTNPHFNSAYTTLDHMIDETKPLLHKHGLTVMQFPGGDGERVTVRTMILHDSGEWIESEALTLKAVKLDPQGAGSAITYARRYSYAAALSLSLGDDDDGNGASQPPARTEQPRQSNTVSSQQNTNTGQASASGDCISEGQTKMLYAKWKSSVHKDLPKPDVCQLLSAELNKNIGDFKEIKKNDINNVIKWFEEHAA
ncbi:ERF family protein [Paenibacillus alba]|uniref:ERF family protein n=1 Tax=Paenibacillus alba TaxID=1197127 RepID=A0ABU6GAH2_9BACL|nr:ERF family protein [Paenibacillus alba]MEC0231146.1 ERF family protein [Paenibacillus alba]